MNSGFAGRRKQVESALLDYHRTPGKYSLLLRRPEILFSSIKEVLLLASGRLPEGEPAPSLAIQRAAGFFVRVALLYPAADHYALLGLDRSADVAAVKERYRQMMRLMHPDFASSAAAGGNWPADAAARINQAYEVLASNAQRSSYDEKLNPTATAPAHWSASNHSLTRVRAATKAPALEPRRLLKRIAGAFGILGAMVLAASLLARGPDRESLVQRATPRSPPAVVVAQSEASAAPISTVVEPSMPTEPVVLLPVAPPALLEAPPASSVPSKLELMAPAALPRVPAVQLPLAAAPQAGRMISVSVETPAQPSATTTLPAASMAQAPAPLAPVVPVPTQSKPNAAPAVTLAEAHTLLSTMLQQMESGSGERILSGLDRNARKSPSAQALAREYNGLVEGSRSVKVSNVLLKADPREDRLLVKGQVLLDLGDFGDTHTKALSLEAEFVKRSGAVVMTRLAPAQVTGAGAQ
jgi:hypothetical protein